MKPNLPGPKTRAIIERDRAVISPAYTRGYPLVIERGQGSYVIDPDGNRFLDFTAGVAVNALGHAHPEVVKAVQDQAARFLHMAGTDFYYEVMVDFARRLSDTVPIPGAKSCFLTNSGTESIEAAIKLARYVTRRPRMIGFFGAFHGRSMGSLALTASKPAQRRHFAPLLPDVSHAPYGDLDFIETYLFKRTTPPEDVAAIFVEPVQGEGGYNVAPEGFLAGLRKICDKHGILLVIDEVQTGLGRTGRWWAVEHWNVQPDILCCAKPIGGGLPLGAMISSAKLQSWPSGAHANTFGGNPLACAAGLKTIEVIQRDKLVDAAREKGAHLKSRLEELSKAAPGVVRPRGLGLMQAVDIVTSDGKPDPDRRNRIVDAAYAEGLLILGCGETGIRFLPAMNVTADEIDQAVALLRRALAAA